MKTEIIIRHTGMAIITVLLSASLLQCKGEVDQAQSQGGQVQISIPSVGDSKATSSTIQLEEAARQNVLAYLKAMQANGDLTFTSTGDGDMILVDSLQGVKNEGADGKNWMYAIDGRLADRGVAAMPVQAGQKIVWCFITYAERESCGKAEAHP